MVNEAEAATAPAEDMVERLRREAASNRRQAESAVRMGGPTAFVGEAAQLRKNADSLDLAVSELARSEKHRNDLMDKIVSQQTEIGALRRRAEASEAQVAKMREDRVDAERWRALMASQRMHFMGSAGFDYEFEGESRERSKLIAAKTRPGEPMHFGMEFWSEHSAFGNPKFPDSFERKLITAYVDEIRARAALASPEQNG